ncbi:unnamed protein product [Arabis nemorensis]|uniref:Uncharacterized protein n=1 Tax=Arabis nemorensis TaxID=586526 RepID=A0A565AU13_9BRAS|nr:unnamed protein product [Arabis nemorensis]
MSTEEQEKNQLLLEDDPEAETQEMEPATVAKDAATGEELTPLDGLSVIPTAQS